jgi:hypothetical protein
MSSPHTQAGPERSVPGLGTVVALVAVVLALALPTAADASPLSRLTPTVTCVVNNTDGSITAHFGYVNSWTNQITVPIGIRTGGANAFSPTPEDRGQPTQLDPGTVSDVFTVTFTGASLTWMLDDAKGTPNSATATSSSTACAPVPALGFDSPLPLAFLAVGLVALLARRERRLAAQVTA